MKEYLNGYLEVLPASQRAKIEDILKKNEDLYNTSSVSEKEFKELIDRIAEEHKPLTEVLPQTDKLDENLHNSFFSNTMVDLNMLFLDSLMIESATSNYERIFDGIISDLEKEISKLNQRVEDLKIVNQGEDGLIIVQKSFDSENEMQDRTKLPSVFVDRDGSSIPSVSFERRHDQYFISLSKTSEADALRENGSVTAKVEVKERRGVPSKVETNSKKYAIENMLESDDSKYWSEVVITSKPINSSMKKG